MRGFYYLGSPYSHPDLAIQESRYREAQRATVWLLNNGLWTYSPIVYGHELSKAYKLPTNHEFWSGYNTEMLHGAKALLVLTIDGWKVSRGLLAEMTEAVIDRTSIYELEPIGSSYVLHQTPPVL